MARERTLSIIKPDATRRDLTGAINADFSLEGLHDWQERNDYLDYGGPFEF